jgi:hypothetical protein
VDELWSDDFEVLHWVVERFERNGHRVEVGEALRVFPEEHYDSVRESLRRLSSYSYPVAVNGSGTRRGGRPAVPVVADVTGHALRDVGECPDNAELLADRMLAVLVEGAVQEPDPEKRSKLKAGLEGVGGMTRDVLVSVLAATVARSTPPPGPGRATVTRSLRSAPSHDVGRAGVGQLPDGGGGQRDHRRTGVENACGPGHAEAAECLGTRSDAE